SLQLQQRAPPTNSNMASSRSSCTTEESAAPRSRPQAQDGSNSTSPSARPNEAATRTLLSPLDGSLALWGAGRRERIAELEVELRQHDAQQHLPTATATAEETLSEEPAARHSEAGQERGPGEGGGRQRGGGGRGGRERGGGQDQTAAAGGESTAPDSLDGVVHHRRVNT
ncbi:unnamed protein product, partial [Laminaria digitata]